MNLGSLLAGLPIPPEVAVLGVVAIVGLYFAWNAIMAWTRGMVMKLTFHHAAAFAAGAWGTDIIGFVWPIVKGFAGGLIP